MQEPPQKNCDVEIDIMAWLPKSLDEDMSAGCLKYVLPFERAKQKVVQLLERVARGEVEYFAVSLREPLKKRR